MTNPPPPTTKELSLKQYGALNPQPDAVTDPLFGADEFFDPRDLVQVRYEMVRRVQVDGQLVVEAVRTFGCSRPTFYKAKAALAAQGLVGLIPRKRGPRGAHKMKEGVLAAVLAAKADDPSLSPEDLAALVLARFRLSVHSRTVRRALSRQGEKQL